MCFHWKSLRRQVRVRGPVEIVTRRGGRRILRDAAARQPHRRLGVEAVAAAGKPLRAGKGGRRIHRQISRSATSRARRHWSGFRIVPTSIEFWHDRPFRLHDRLVFTRGEDGDWEKTRLYP